MEDDSELRSLQRRTNIGRTVTLTGWLLIVLAGPLGWSRMQVTEQPESPGCTWNGKPIDCGMVGISHPAPAPIVREAFNPAPDIIALLIMGCGIFIAVIARSEWDALKQEMVDYADRRARDEGTAPDYCFLYFFDTRSPGSAEWSILRRAYFEMRSYDPYPVSYGFDPDRPYRIIREGEEVRR